MCSIYASHHSNSGTDTPLRPHPSTRVEFVEQGFYVTVNVIERRTLFQHVSAFLIKIKLAFSASQTKKKKHTNNLKSESLRR
jgi:hypothetical protein